jgi:hypothetical protein
MIRFPNPGSDINQMINIFKLLYANLSESQSFDLNNMADIMVTANVASSSGYIGAQALERSYERKDTSRNPLYNQAKMYAEVYRFMGWIVSSEDAALRFNFTFLGIHVATAGDSSGKLFEQCLLGINYPNKILDVRFRDINKPFVSIMKIVSLVDGEICRDEILIGPMNLSNGYNDDEIENAASTIKNIRSTRKYSSLESELGNLSGSLGITINTMRNYTRFVISALVFCGWVIKIDSKVYGSKRDFLKITPKGTELVAWLDKVASVNGSVLLEKDQKIIDAVSKVGFLQMLKRADFIVEEDLAAMEVGINEIAEAFGEKEVLFSPYQYFDKLSIKEVLPDYETDIGDEAIDFSVGRPSSANYTFKSDKSIGAVPATTAKSNTAKQKLLEILAECKSDIHDAIIRMNGEAISMKQTEFYPFIAELFQIIFGLDARAPQAGVNNERFDVIIPDQKFSIPVEVKSPTEELMLSVKAVRQALENKIVLLSRYVQPYPTVRAISTFAVGYNIPNERSDVYKLIEDIHSVYGINIAIVNVDVLLSAAYYSLLNNKNYLISDFSDVRGVISFANL